jgi:hypothetical protein
LHHAGKTSSSLLNGSEIALCLPPQSARILFARFGYWLAGNLFVKFLNSVLNTLGNLDTH